MEYTWTDEGPTESCCGPSSVLLTAFPSAGLATIIAGHYMVRTLELPRVGRFDSPELAPVAVVQGGEVNPTIRVYGRRDLALVLSEFPPTPSQANAIARTVLDNAARRGVRIIVCLEGVVPNPESESEDADDGPTAGGAAVPPSTAAEEQVWVTYARKDSAVASGFESAGARPLEEGVIGGVSGALLVQGIGRPVPVAALLVSARVAEGLPDHRAGAALIETLDRILPELKIDTGPLRAQAEQIEKTLRAVMKRRAPAAASSDTDVETDRPPVPEMYR